MSTGPRRVSTRGQRGTHLARTADPHAKSALVAAARTQFVRSGIKGARIEDITHASRLSKGSFYLHFESKEALFGELVERFEQQMERIVVERERAVHDYLARHPLTGRGSVERAAKHQGLMALEMKYDRAVLELIWTERDVFTVLSRGAQGTAYESFMWQMAESEVKRVVEELESMKSFGACRPDVPSQVFASLVVGTFLLIAQQMSRLEKKPDLDVWVQAIRRLINEGVAPREAAAPRRRRPARRNPVRASERRLS
ncbi:MAG: transcriptional regulator, TetR family [Myxococcaceae bacterium]|nr:transcriptional regulator, TetR family [Myxococcaceae bacterium]